MGGEVEGPGTCLHSAWWPLSHQCIWGYGAASLKSPEGTIPFSLHFLSVTPSVVTSLTPLLLRKKSWWQEVPKGHPLLPSLVALSCWQHTGQHACSSGKPLLAANSHFTTSVYSNKPIPPTSSIGLPRSLHGSGMLCYLWAFILIFY